MKKTTFFSNEDLDNILRGMEGLTTDEKEAYLDARLKEKSFTITYLDRMGEAVTLSLEEDFKWDE